MQESFLQFTYTLEEIEAVAKAFWAKVHPYSLFAFSGEMGAGKTTFIHKLCDYLRVADSVSSPTFALINEYHFEDKTGMDNTIYHMDWYRIKDIEEAMEAGMEDCIIQTRLKNIYCFIEWPERAIELLTQPYLLVSIENKSMLERKMHVTLIE